MPSSKHHRSRRHADPRLAAIEKEVSRRVEIEYRDDIIKHMKDMEELTSANASIIDTQPELEWFMRPHLLDFLIESHQSFGLKPEALFLTINLIDRYCSTRVVYKKHFQLVGCTALWIAAKYEDKARTPTLKDLEHLCNGVYSADMFVQMEIHLLNTLNWQVGHPTVESFMQMCLGTSTSNQEFHIARFLCELALYQRTFIGVQPSILAYSACTLAMIIMGHYPTIPSNISQREVQCINLLNTCIKSPSKTLTKKYSRNSYGQVAMVVHNYVARQDQQSMAFPPTPPPLSTASPNCTTGSTTAATTPYQSPAYSQMKNDLHIQVPSSVKRSEGYITPPCTPADQDQQQQQSRPHPSAAANPKSSFSMEFQSVPMETTRAFI